MNRVIFFTAVVLAVCAKTERCDNECGLRGKWVNQENSTVIISSCRNGQIDGKYNTAVGDASDYYVLSGRYTLSGPEGDAVQLGWVVSWNNEIYGNSNSTTAWNGIYYPDGKIIHTQWIFTRYADRRNLWTTSLINHDEFKRA